MVVWVRVFGGFMSYGGKFNSQKALMRVWKEAVEGDVRWVSDDVYFFYCFEGGLVYCRSDVALKSLVYCAVAVS